MSSYSQFIKLYGRSLAILKGINKFVTGGPITARFETLNNTGTVHAYFIKAVLGLLFLLLLSYFNTSIYDFPEPEPFSGQKWHNPYKDLDSSHWRVGNFHDHANVWFGITNGTGTNDSLYDTYFNRLGYDVLGISNYEKIDENSDGRSQIRTYEHGYSPTKNHHIVIGAEKVCWMEYPLIQSIHQKQHVLKILKTYSENETAVAIAHPKRGGAVSLEDMKYLTYYDCVEAFNHLSTSVAHWDAALSAGHPVYLLASDDSHDYSHIFGVGRHATVIHDAEGTEKNIVQSIKNGRTFGAEIFTDHTETFEIHKKRVLGLEKIRHVGIDNNRLDVLFSDTCSTIRFIGQNGELKKTIENSPSASYVLQANDTYIRTEATFKSSLNIFYLNPVFRMDGDGPEKRVATVNLSLTILYRLAIAGCMFLILRVILKWKRKPKLN